MTINRKFAVALDIGGTKIEGALINDSYKIIKKERIFFDKKKTDLVVKTPRKQVMEMLSALIDRLAGSSSRFNIGISYPDVIMKNGSISKDTKIEAFQGFDLNSYLARKYKTASVIANDADCFALAEQRLGAARGYQNVIGIIIGTGVGAGLIINGSIYPGTTGSAGEFAHSILNAEGPKDRNGIPGTVEAYVGGPNLLINYYRAGGKLPDAGVKEIFESKERAAKKVIDDWFRYLGISLGMLMNTLNPGVFVLGGGQSNLPIYRRLNAAVKRNSLGSMRPYVKIVKNQLGDSAGIYGAAVLAFEADVEKSTKASR